MPTVSDKHEVDGLLLSFSLKREQHRAEVLEGEADESLQDFLSPRISAIQTGAVAFRNCVPHIPSIGFGGRKTLDEILASISKRSDLMHYRFVWIFSRSEKGEVQRTTSHVAD